MRYKITFVAGFGVGYVLGARAGHQRYEAIRDAWRRFLDTPAVQETAGLLQAQATGALDRTKRQVTHKLNTAVTDRIRGHGHMAAANGSTPAATYPSGG